jgi:hypothetical protein
MPKLTNGSTELSVETKDQALLVTLSASQYTYASIERCTELYG